MKKFISNIFVFISLLLVSAVAVPWNHLAQWGIRFSFLDGKEFLIKAGIAGLLFVFSLIFLLVSNHEYRKNGVVSKAAVRASVFPLWMYSIGFSLYGLILSLFNYQYISHTPTNLYITAGIGLFILNLIVFWMVFASSFQVKRNGSRWLLFVFLIEIAGASAGIGYYALNYLIPSTIYPGLNTYNYIIIPAVALGLYILFMILSALRSGKVTDEELLESEVEEMQTPRKASKTKKDVLEPQKEKKTIIVNGNQPIVSKESNIDPTEVLYQEVSIDPEFTRMNGSSQVNSIDYYIEKPKMFKPLDPAFDALVEYIRELPNVVTKLSDEKITFYVNRTPFMVLMNYGNYYRMAFKYDLEKGIRLIIKYPTISKNKSTKDDVWFKANNYGDLPKDVIYQIVKNSYDFAGI